MPPPESGSRVENIKKKFEDTNNDLTASITNNSRFIKTPVNKNIVGIRAQSSNGVKSNIFPRKKILNIEASSPIDTPKKSPNPSPSIRTPLSVPVKAERQLSNSCGRGHIRRSPAFRCDKIVRGRNVTRQTSGIHDKTRSVVDNRVKLFEDGQNVMSVVKKFNTPPLASSDSADVAKKSLGSQFQKQLALECVDAAEKVRTVMNSGNIVSSIYVARNPHVNNPSTCTDFSDKTILSNRTGLKKSEAVPQQNKKLPKPGAASFLHKYEHHKEKLPPGNKQFNSAESKEVKLTALPNRNEENNCKVTNDIKSENGQESQEMLQNEATSSGITLTDTLKAALKAPLPSGPPPKKPPRTFAHNTSSPDSAGENTFMPSATTTSAIEEVSNLSQHINITKNASEKENVEKIVKPVRSKTESQIMLKKLESVLLRHGQGTGRVVLRPKSPVVRKNIENKATVTYSEPDLNTGRSVGRLRPLPSLPLESELPISRDTCAGGDIVRFGGCLNFSCVSADSNNPLYSQIHLYEKVPEKQSEFFVESPKICSPPKSLSKPYGTLLHCRSRSEEHIYAEPFDYFNRVQNHRHNLQDWKTSKIIMTNGESVGDLSKTGESVEFQNHLSPFHPEIIISKTGTLHYLVSEK